MNGASSSAVMRLARLVRPHSNPLARGVDRLESRVLILVVLIALLLLPIMLVLGSLTYANLSATGEQQARTRHETIATLTEDAPTPSIDVHGVAATNESDVMATWRLPDGSTETGLVPAADGLTSGARVEIWLDQDGRPVDAPVTSTEIGMAAVTISGVGWLTIVGLLALLQLGIHRILDRRRYRAWDQEWAQVEPGWNNYRC